MITKALVVFQHGRTFTGNIDFSDPRGIEVGNAYMFNIDGATKEWKIAKIVRDYAKAEPSTDD